MEKTPFGNHHSNNSAKKHHQMLKSEGKVWWGTVCLQSQSTPSNQSTYWLQIQIKTLIINFKGTKNNVIMERPSRQKFNQKITPICDKSNTSSTWKDAKRTHQSFWDIPAKNARPESNNKKHQTKPNWGIVYTIIDLCNIQNLSVMKVKKSSKTVLHWRRLKKHDN